MKMKLFTLFGAFILSFVAPQAGATDAKSSNEDGFERVMETPIEPLLPCTPDDQCIIYTLKAVDGKNIQVAIECRNGTLTAHWPLDQDQTNSEEEAQ